MHDGFSRRQFLQGLMASGTAAVLPVGVEAAENRYPATDKAAPTYDFTRGSGALLPDRVVDSACQFCNCNCRLKVSVKDHRIIDVVGEPADPVQAGGICVKGPMMTQLVYNRHRLTQPLKRVSGDKGDPSSTFAPISWDEALDTLARRMLALRDQDEPWAVVNKTSGRLPRGTGSLVHRVFELLGSPNDTDVGPVCNDAGGDALATTFGMGNFTNGYGVDPATGREDLGSARTFLFLGTNQAETQPVTFAHLLRCRAKSGARLIVVDPRQTPTAAQADEWIAPKPHTDLALALGMLHHILQNELYDRTFVQQWVIGFDALRAHVLGNHYAPEWAGGVCDVPAETIRRLAHRYATEKPSAIFCNAGISHQLSAFDTYRTLAFLAAITGNIGVPGAGCNFMHNTWPGGLDLPPVKGTTPPRRSGLPVGPDAFATSILDGVPYRMKLLIVEGNPLLGSANTKRVREAFKKLEFLAYTGLFMEETAWYADLILPVC
ncbi:MAG TPA: molybdopterin-dependent oxidoreductase, partial [Candidatus Xenobia bacterium]